MTIKINAVEETIIKFLEHTKPTVIRTVYLYPLYSHWKEFTQQQPYLAGGLVLQYLSDGTRRAKAF